MSLVSTETTMAFLGGIGALLFVLNKRMHPHPYLNYQYCNNASKLYPFTVTLTNTPQLHADLKHVVKAICPEWSTAPEEDIQIKIIAGGITNLLYRLIWKNKAVLVRLYGESTDLMIDRAEDNYIFAELSKQGYAPVYHGQFTNGRIEQWMPSRPLEPAEMQQVTPIDFMQYIATELAQLHLMDISVSKEPFVWKSLLKFSTITADIQFEDPSKQEQFDAVDVAYYRNEISWLQETISTIPPESASDMEREAHQFAMDLVFCHNDLLSGNILYQDNWQRVQVIDYEYGGYNYRAFDIANHFNEHAGFDCDYQRWYPSHTQQLYFLQHYLQIAAPELAQKYQAASQLEAFLDAFLQQLHPFILASHLMWGLWGIVQARYSPIEFDFLAYTQLRFKGYQYHKNLYFP